MKSIALFILLCTAGYSYGQLKTYEKAKKLFEEGNLKGANKLVDKALSEKETKDNPNVLLLKSKIMFSIYTGKDLLEKFPSALKDAMRYAEKSIEENPSESAQASFKQAHIEYFSKLIRQNNKEAIEAYNSRKYSKALPLFKRSIYFGLDTQSLVLAGDCYWQMGQKHESVPYFKKSAEMIYAAVLDSQSRVYGYHKEPFRKLGKFHIDQEQFDSAYIIVKNGREILPNDPVLSEYTYQLMRYTLNKIPPSEDYLNMVKTSLKDFPTDSFLNHRENSIYIYLLNGMAIANEQVQFDTLLNRYAASKVAKAKMKGLETILKFDIFAGKPPSTFIPELKSYFAEVGLPEACYATGRAWIDLYGSKTTEKDIEAEILSDAKNENKPLVAEIIFKRHLQLYPKASTFNKGRAEYTTSKNKGPVAYYELLPMIQLNDASSKDFPKDPGFKVKAKEYRLRIISEAADSGDMRLARKTWKESSKMYPDQQKVMDQQWKKIVENDFKLNYYGSRINAKGKNEKNVPEYAWDGNADSCKAGSMSMEVVTRLEQRINYFRRMAGVDEEVFLSDQDNEFCRYAVLMCEANKSMSHEPNDGWRCYIPAGADALKQSILSKDANPSIAITAAMGQNHATVGNRRWLLYPKSLYMGIASSRSFSAIKAIDNSNTLDSNKYKNAFVAWPPAKHCPKMLVFKKWSFSIDQNLQGAVVSMKDKDGKSVELKQEPYTAGYGLNTVVWEPSINLTTDMDYTVSIKLNSGKTYSYVVNIIDVKLP
jgi:tetratricopeptide (TPR) repeat protein